MVHTVHTINVNKTFSTTLDKGLRKKKQQKKGQRNWKT